MKKYVKNSLIALILLFLIGSIFIFRSSWRNERVIIKPPLKVMTPQEIEFSYLSDEAILNSLGWQMKEKESNTFGVVREKNGCFSRSADETGSIFDLCNVSRGDLNNDGYIDAAGIFTSCGASCGNKIVAIINNKDGTGTLHFLKSDSIVTSGAGQTSLYRLYVIDDNIAVLGSGFIIKNSKKNSINYVKYHLDGDNLIIVDSK